MFAHHRTEPSDLSVERGDDRDLAGHDRGIGVPADLLGQHRIRQAVRSHWRLPVGVRGQPARVDRRGCLEYAALLTGYDNLLIVAGVLYLAAFTLTPRGSRLIRAP
jgi:hypothetical protein